jgi:hypothetical protein
MFVAADKAWYIQLFGYNDKIITFGECVSFSTAKGVHQGSRSVADGLDLHSTTNTSDWVRSLWEHERVCVDVFDTTKLRGGGWILGDEGSCGGGELSCLGGECGGGEMTVEEDI